MEIVYLILVQKCTPQKNYAHMGYPGYAGTGRLPLGYLRHYLMKLI